MKVLVTGGTGLIGSALIPQLIAHSHSISLLTRRKSLPHFPEVTPIIWNGRNESTTQSSVEGMDAVINLAGENLGGGLWTTARKQAILSSRMESGAALKYAFQNTKNKPGVFIQASAVGYYGAHHDEELTETSPAGNDFLADVCQQWEASTQEVEGSGVRRVVIRTGIVLDRHHGALGRLLLPYNLFLGGPLGGGAQWFSWIHLQDEVNAILHVLEHEQCKGVYNLTSPNPVTQNDFGKVLGKILHRPHWFPTPAFVLRMLLGELSMVVLKGQRVMPERLQKEGFVFQFPDLVTALKNTLQQKNLE